MAGSKVPARRAAMKKTKQFYVEAIRAERKAADGSGREYLVHWAGFPANGSTWERRRDINAEALQEWEDRGGERDQDMIASEHFYAHIDGERRLPNGEYEYHVQWQGFPASSASWENRRDINQEAFDDWMQRETANLDDQLDEMEVDEESETEATTSDNAAEDDTTERYIYQQDEQLIKEDEPFGFPRQEESINLNEDHPAERTPASRQADSTVIEQELGTDIVPPAAAATAHDEPPANDDIANIPFLDDLPLDGGLSISDWNELFQSQDTIN